MLSSLQRAEVAQWSSSRFVIGRSRVQLSPSAPEFSNLLPFHQLTFPSAACRKQQTATCFESSPGDLHSRLFRSRSGARADDQFRLDHDFFGVGGLRGRSNALEQRLRCEQSHPAQRLPYRRQRRILEGGTLDVIKAHHRNIFGDTPASFAQRLDGADRGNIIECEKSSEGFARGEQFSCNLITQRR